MNELKRACLALLTTQAWLETVPPLETREAIKGRLERVLFWYRESMSKRWMHQAGVLQLNDWQSAWRAREQSIPEALLRELSFIDAVMPLFTITMENPREYGLRMPGAREHMHEMIKELLMYRAAVVEAAEAKELAIPDAKQQTFDELQIYFERVATAVR